MIKGVVVNPLLRTDWYNLSHEDLKCNTDWEVSHMYNRTGGGMILYGLNKIVDTCINFRVEQWMIDDAVVQTKDRGPEFPAHLFQRIIDEFDGYIPLKIEALPDGTWCPEGTPFAQISNTVEGFGELVTWWEAALMKAYFPSACATEAFHMRRYLKQKQRQYGYDDSFLWRFHSFGYRGHKSDDDAYWAGMAWAMFLHGTDDVHVVSYLPLDAKVGSIWASAHKVTQQFDDEYEGYKHTVDAAARKNQKAVSLPIDTYDANRFIREYLLPLALYASRKNLAIVIRPDSGNTWQQVVDAYAIVKRNNLTNVFAIIGENMNFFNAQKADRFFEDNGVPLNFVNYGIGAGFYKHIDRDTHGWAMKTAYSNGKDRMKFSMEPLKRSIPGRVFLAHNNAGDLVVHPHLPGAIGEYKVLYYFDSTDAQPYFKEQDWQSARDLAFEYQVFDQERIFLSQEILDKVDNIKTHYMV